MQKLRGFAGAAGTEGILVTTSSFTKEAVAFAAAIDSKIVLIGGEELVALMIDHNIGVTPIAAYQIKRVDIDYFAGSPGAPASHKAVEPTANSVRSSLASASGGGSPPACVPSMLSCSGVKLPCLGLAGAEGQGKRQGVTVRWGLKEAWNEGAGRGTRTRYEVWYRRASWARNSKALHPRSDGAL